MCGCPRVAAFREPFRSSNPCPDAALYASLPPAGRKIACSSYSLSVAPQPSIPAGADSTNECHGLAGKPCRVQSANGSRALRHLSLQQGRPTTSGGATLTPISHDFSEDHLNVRSRFFVLKFIIFHLRWIESERILGPRAYHTNANSDAMWSSTSDRVVGRWSSSEGEKRDPNTG
jgi:hypothetical protein